MLYADLISMVIVSCPAQDIFDLIIQIILDYYYKVWAPDYTYTILFIIMLFPSLYFDSPARLSHRINNLKTSGNYNVPPAVTFNKFVFFICLSYDFQCGLQVFP
jgi:hypothetical protein